MSDGLDLAGIKTRAEAATQGLWTAHYASGLHDEAAAWIGAPGVTESGLFVASVSNTVDGLDDAAHIAGMDPATTLALVDEVERLRTAVVRVRLLADAWRGAPVVGFYPEAAAYANARENCGDAIIDELDEALTPDAAS